MRAIFLPINEKPTNLENDIFEACNNGNLPSVQWLIERKNISLDIKGQNEGTLLHYACHAGHLPIVEYLLYKGCNPLIKDINGHTPAHVACLYGHLSIVKYFLDNNYVDPNIKGQNDCTLLHYTCHKDYLQIIDYLIHKGCKFTIKDICENMPVHTACLGGHLHVVKYFIENNYIDKDIKGQNNCTLLHYACLL